MIKHKKIDNSILRRPMLPVLALVVGGAALVAVAILLVAVVGERDRLNTLYDQESQHALTNSYQTQRITFCHDNELSPCTDDVLEAWNKAYPDNTFSVTAPQL